MTDLKEIAARALGIVERLREYSPIEKAEVLAIAQVIINIELGRVNRPQPPPADEPTLRVGMN